MTIPTTLQAVAERYGIPKTITRKGKECRLFNIVTKNDKGDLSIDAIYIMPGRVHSIEIDFKFGGDDK